jgi:hypothetical protein
MAEEKSKKKKWLVWGMVVSIIVLLFSPVLLFRAVNKAAFNRKVAELKAAGYPVSLDDLEAAYVLPEGVENAADLYLKAFRAYVEPNEAAVQFLPVCGTLVRTEDMPPFPPEVMEAVRVRLEENAECLELLDRAGRMGYCRFPRTRSISFFGTEALSSLKKVCQLLAERSLYLAQTGQIDAAYESILTEFEIPKSLAVQPMLIDHLVIIAMQGLAVSGLEDSLNLVQFTDAQLAELQQRLRSMQPMRDYAKVLIAERAWTLEMVGMMSDDTSSSVMLSNLPFKLYSFSGLKDKDAMLLLDSIEQQRQILQLPYHEHLAEVNKLNAELESYSWIHWLLMMAPATAKISSINLRVEGGIRCAETAVAVERYRLKYGKLPEGLDELVPEFLGAVYLDPFDGRPLRYVLRAEGGYMIYSIGEDGKDQGGKSREEMIRITGLRSTPEHDCPFTVRR